MGACRTGVAGSAVGELGGLGFTGYDRAVSAIVAVEFNGCAVPASVVTAS